MLEKVVLGSCTGSALASANYYSVRHESGLAEPIVCGQKQDMPQKPQPQKKAQDVLDVLTESTDNETTLSTAGKKLKNADKDPGEQKRNAAGSFEWAYSLYTAEPVSVQTPDLSSGSSYFSRKNSADIGFLVNGSYRKSMPKVKSSEGLFRRIESSIMDGYKAVSSLYNGTVAKAKEQYTYYQAKAKETVKNTSMQVRAGVRVLLRGVVRVYQVSSGSIIRVMTSYGKKGNPIDDEFYRQMTGLIGAV
jgi:hypothetical protein